jgi:D-xylose transport system ATP-binding protein
MPDGDGAPLLELRGVSKRFGAVQALTDVDFAAQAGKVTALVGDNGAGKSTLIKTISGINQMDDGEYRFDGQPVQVNTPQAATALGIATVYQDLALCDNLDVVANLWLGREELSGTRTLDETSMEQEATRVLRRLAVRIPSVRTQVADTIVVLRLGRQVGVLDAKETSSDEVVATITGSKSGNEQQSAEVTDQ